jgi:eukaryotic-like serine/threonine-protein kinase
VAVDTNLLPLRYRDPKLIGRGGMGEIYRATDETLGRPVAIKVLAERYARDESVRGRFTREALAAARLSGDPNTVTIFDVGEHEGRPFIVMEYLAGGSLAERLEREGAQRPERALEWLEQAGRALDAAHGRGVVHRDVKPANLLLDGEDVVHVADFGIASAAGMDSLTATGTVLGTAAYLSPEQASGQRATAASDLYGLGVVAFELLTGERPYQADSATAEAAAHVHAPIPSAVERNPDLPRRVDAVVRRVLAKRPEERFSTCEEFVAALGAALHGPRTATTQPIAPAAPARRRRAPVWPLVLALVLAAGAIGAIVAGIVASGDDTPQPRAVTKTIRQRGTTRTITSTVQAASSSTPTSTTTAAPPPPTPAQSGASGADLNNQGFARMRAGDYQGALPLLEQAVAKLNGTGSLDEAYADYNLAFTRLQLGSCDGVTDLLDHSESIQGHRKEIDRARKQAGKQCGG